MCIHSRFVHLAILFLALGLGSTLGACTDSSPTPLAAIPTTATNPSPAPTTPKATATPTWTPTLVPPPTAVPTRTSAPTTAPTRTFTPAPTLTPSLSPSPTPTPTVTANSTSTLEAQLAAALHLQDNGEYEPAIAAYRELLSAELSPEQAREVQYRLAEVYLLDRTYAESAAAWEEYLAAYPDDERLPQAAFMAARAFQGANECEAANVYYEQYRSRASILADLAYEWQGDCLADLSGEAADRTATLNEAIAAYRHAVEASRDRAAQMRVRVKVAEAFQALDDPEAAAAEYQALLQDARTASERARFQYLAGKMLASAGQTQAAHQRYQRAMDSAPKTEFAYRSLLELVDAGVYVDEFQRGMVSYWAGATDPAAYEAAIRAFDRYLGSGSGREADEALYYKALAQRAVEQPGAALETLDLLLAQHAESEILPRVWLAKATTLARMGNTPAAVQTYQDLATRFPASEQAPNALWEAAELRESEGALAEAAVLFSSVQARFPSHKDAAEALWYAGLARYRASEPQSAATTWQALLDKFPKSNYAAKSLYWLGKAGAKPQSGDGRDYWDQLLATRPGNYYARRVAQIRAGESLTSTRLSSSPIAAPAWNLPQAAGSILDWLSGWTPVPDGTQLTSVPDDLAHRSDLRRGEALLDVGLRREALDAFDRVRAAASDNPVALAQLALYFREQGFAGLAARSALRLAGLWPEGAIAAAPLPLQQIAYPLAYADLLSREAQARNLDPLLLAALVRQESLFEPVAESYAGARGLGQVMPATGRGLARNLEIEDFDLDDLYRPALSVRFAAYYLEIQMGRFDDHILIALAAYNGGPGNTLRWLERSGSDLDLFVEVITANQSRVYLQRVYNQYLIYERLYRSTGSEPGAGTGGG